MTTNYISPITINGETYIKQNVGHDNYVIVRTYSAGVHYGKLDRKDGKEVVLSQARRLWYWEGAASLSQMAVEGVKKPKECKFSVRVPQICLTEAIEIIQVTLQAYNSIEEVLEWKV